MYKQGEGNFGEICEKFRGTNSNRVSTESTARRCQTTSWRLLKGRDRQQSESELKQGSEGFAKGDLECLSLAVTIEGSWIGSKEAIN